MDENQERSPGRDKWTWILLAIYVALLMASAAWDTLAVAALSSR